MSKRYMPSLDALDAGETPVLGVRDREELDLLEGLESEELLLDDRRAPGYAEDLFDPYE